MDYQIAGFEMSRVLLTLRDRQRNASLECSFYETAATQFELECLQNELGIVSGIVYPQL